MESDWDTLRALGAVTAACLLLWAAWGVGCTVYVYLLPPVRRGAPWLRAHGAWAGERQGPCAWWVDGGRRNAGTKTDGRGGPPIWAEAEGSSGSKRSEGWAKQGEGGMESLKRYR